MRKIARIVTVKKFKMRRQQCKCVVLALAALLLVTHSGIDFAQAKRAWSSSSSRKSPSSSNTHVTRPSYPQQSSGGSNSHADVAKLSYPNYNSQPNHASGGTAGNAAPIGWNVPKAGQGPPPAYSPHNTAGGAHTNVHEAPPAYHPNNAPPPSYGASNVHTPITASNAHGVQSSYPGQQMGGGYYGGGAAHPPAGANYYPAGGALPAGATYYPAAGGHAPMGGGGYYPGAAAGGHMPAGATYLPAGASIPAGATYYSQPPSSSSSGLGFGSGLAAGALGGALLGHVLTPSGGTRVIEQAPAAAAAPAGGDPKIIIINNGVPVNATDANGVTVINAHGEAVTAAPAAAGVTETAIPHVPLAPMDAAAAAPAANATAMEQPQAPPAGGIICVPVRVNETDPADSTKMIEVEKIACYPAPPPQAAPVAAETVTSTTNANAGETSAPLAPLNAAAGQAPLLPEQSSVRSASNGGIAEKSAAFGLFACAFFSLLLRSIN